MLTPDGCELLWEIATRQREDDQFAAFMRLSDGKQTAQVPIDEPVVEEGQLTCVATFDEDQANFEWSEESIISAEGVVVATFKDDRGRKTKGTILTLRITLTLTSENDDSSS